MGVFKCPQFCHCQNVLKLQACESVSMKETSQAQLEKDTILCTDVKTYACWKHSRCNMNEIADDFGADNFDFHCCQKDFCNKSPATVVSKTTFSIATVMTMIWIAWSRNSLL
uniref:CD59 glycoprotein n=1 Tax=Chrysemys picta bellii TaxID=8478 RepID=A0A8C3FFX3_CHRPI